MKNKKKIISELDIWFTFRLQVVTWDTFSNAHDNGFFRIFTSIPLLLILLSWNHQFWKSYFIAYVLHILILYSVLWSSYVEKPKLNNSENHIIFKHLSTATSIIMIVVSNDCWNALVDATHSVQLIQAARKSTQPSMIAFNSFCTKLKHVKLWYWNGIVSKCLQQMAFIK